MIDSVKKERKKEINYYCYYQNNSNEEFKSGKFSALPRQKLETLEISRNAKRYPVMPDFLSQGGGNGG